MRLILPPLLPLSLSLQAGKTIISGDLNIGLKRVKTQSLGRRWFLTPTRGGQAHLLSVDCALLFVHGSGLKITSEHTGEHEEAV